MISSKTCKLSAIDMWNITSSRKSGLGTNDKRITLCGRLVWLSVNYQTNMVFAVRTPSSFTTNSSLHPV